jgi:hypothetical protein
MCLLGPVEEDANDKENGEGCHGHSKAKPRSCRKNGLHCLFLHFVYEHKNVIVVLIERVQNIFSIYFLHSDFRYMKRNCTKILDLNTNKL